MDCVREEEAMEAARKWIQHMSTTGIMSMLQQRGSLEDEVDDGHLVHQSREDLVDILAENMARDVVALLKDEADRKLKRGGLSDSKEEETSLFTRLLERYEDPKAMALYSKHINGSSSLLSVGDYASEWLCTLSLTALLIYLVLVLYIFLGPYQMNALQDISSSY